MDELVTAHPIVSVLQFGPLFGGAFSGKKYNFVLFGRRNPKEKASVKSYVLARYTKKWKKKGSVALKDCNTVEPFDAGSASFAEYDNRLYIHTCHKMYQSSDGLNHQANVSITVDTDKMKILDSNTGVSNNSTSYVSHSFNQFAKIDNKDVYFVDHGDAYPRSIYLQRLTQYADGTDREEQEDAYDYSSFWGTKYQAEGVSAFSFSGNIGDNYTNAQIGGFEISDSSFLIVGTYKKSSSAPEQVFVNVTKKSGFEKYISGESKSNPSKQKYITSYKKSSGKSASNPHLVKIKENRFMLLWQEYTKNGLSNKISYCMLDGNGKKISKVKTKKGYLSDCAPILVGSKVVFYYTGSGVYGKNTKPTFVKISAK